MENKYFSFNPGTATCRTPVPERFEHLLGFVPKIEQFLTIHNQEDIVNVNKLLEQTLNLQISNIISRVIAQVIGEYKEGFVTIKGTEDGQLHVYLAGSDETSPVHVIVEELPTASVTVQIEGTSQEVKRAAIWQNTAVSFQVIPLVAGKKLCIVNIAFTVDGAANVSLNSNDVPITGVMDFGETNEPRGFVANHGNFPLKTVAGEAFKIESNTTARIAGYVIYYEE